MEGFASPVKVTCGKIGSIGSGARAASLRQVIHKLENLSRHMKLLRTEGKKRWAVGLDVAAEISLALANYPQSGISTHYQYAFVLPSRTEVRYGADRFIGPWRTYGHRQWNHTQIERDPTGGYRLLMPPIATNYREFRTLAATFGMSVAGARA